MMEKLGFQRSWIERIMWCVTTVSYRIKVNNEYTGQIFPGRGLRQRDPLSPYLFILCAEGLSAMLQKAEAEGTLQGIKICREAPRVNHLFFADDSLILMKAKQEHTQELKRLLEVYEQASGQMINRDKSSVFFSPNTNSHVWEQVRHILSIGQVARCERYLGLPVSVGRSRKKTFEYIKQRIWARIQGWQEKLLSKAGKEILIKAVAQAIPLYAMSCFDLTKGLCEELNSMIGRWRWSNQDKQNKIHWMSWDKLARPKKKGGLGFRDLHLFNLAMLARQGWGILNNPGSLCVQILKAKYFPTTNILECEERNGMSYSWRSILKGVQLLKKRLNLESWKWRINKYLG